MNAIEEYAAAWLVYCGLTVIYHGGNYAFFEWIKKEALKERNKE